MRTPWFTHPVFVFIFSLVALVSSLILYIRSYLQVNEAFENFLKNQKLDPSQFLQSETWVMIMVLSILVAIILLGLLLIFFYYSKVIQLYRQQQNFINGFTHELKTPIASLKLFLDAFSRHEIPRPDQLKYLDYMKRDVERLTDNVSQILNLAKLEDKSYQSQFEFLDFHVFLKDLLDTISHHHLNSLQINLEVIGEGPWVISVERSLLEMAITNIVTNAFIHNENDLKRIDLKLERSARWLALSIKDDGIGLEKKQQKMIFRKFYQVGKSAKGSGIGLYMVSQVMKLHKGSVSVESEGLGKGCRFVLSLPLSYKENN